MAAKRKATVSRETGETKVKVELVIDGKGKCKANTGIGMLDHLLAQIARQSVVNGLHPAHRKVHCGQEWQQSNETKKRQPDDGDVAPKGEAHGIFLVQVGQSTTRCPIL